MTTGKPLKHRTPIEIRFVDIDVFNHVNNATFLTYFEQARIKYFDDVADWSYDWSKKGVIVARAEINYVLPVHFRDNIVIYTSCSRIGNKSFDLQYQMFRVKDGHEQLVADCITVMVAFDYEAGKTIQIPDEWKEAIEHFESPA